MRLSMRGHSIIGVMLLASCGPEIAPEPVPDFELESEWLVVRGYGHEPEEICGGTLDWMDSYIGTLAAHFDLSPTKIGVYNWYSQESWGDSVCSEKKARACAHRQEDTWAASAREIPYEHELHHVVMFYLEHPCVGFLFEGLAEYMRGPFPRSSGSLEQSTIEETLATSFDRTRMSGSDYKRARHFVSFLVYEYGLDDVLALCVAAPPGVTRAAFSDTTSAMLGASLDDLLASYAAYPICSPNEDRAKLWECSREPTIQLGLGEGRVIEIDASCAHPEAVGPRGSNYHFSYQVRILADGEYSWSFIAQPPFDITGAQLELEQCASCGDGAVGFADSWSADVILLPRWLPAGDYTLEIKLPLEFAGMVSVGFSG